MKPELDKLSKVKHIYRMYVSDNRGIFDIHIEKLSVAYISKNNVYYPENGMLKRVDFDSIKSQEDIDDIIDLLRRRLIDRSNYRYPTSKYEYYFWNINGEITDEFISNLKERLKHESEDLEKLDDERKLQKLRDNVYHYKNKLEETQNYFDKVLREYETFNEKLKRKNNE